MTPINYRLLKASAGLCKATSLPLTTHTCPSGLAGLMQQDVFIAEKVDLSRVIIGHSGDTDNIDYLEAILKLGCYLGLDWFGLEMPLSTEKRISTLVVHNSSSRVGTLFEQQGGYTIRAAGWYTIRLTKAPLTRTGREDVQKSWCRKGFVNLEGAAPRCYKNAHYKLHYQNFWNHLSTLIWQFRMLQFVMLVSITNY